MFDITSSKLLILGIVALLVIGPKDLPALLRTIGKYMAIIKRHAADFRSQFDEAIRESELDQLKKDVEKLGSEAETTMRAAEASVDKEMGDMRQEVDTAMAVDTKPATDPVADNADTPSGTPPVAQTVVGDEIAPALNGASHPTPDLTEAPAEKTADEPGSPSVKAGA